MCDSTTVGGARVDPHPMNIVVSALTYLRPQGLARLLGSLAALDRPPGSEVSVIIVDNDPERSAESIATAGGAAGGYEVTYLCEPARGISTARNTAVAAAVARGADAICFIDDDEWCEPDWLCQLVATAEATGADVVTGPVLPVFEQTPPTWVTRGGFFDRPRHEHNEPLDYATTSSVLISTRCFADRPAPFDIEFGLSGGSDTHLFAELLDDGFAIAWCDRAIVYETIPPTRVSISWMLRREYRRGQTLSRSLRRRRPAPIRYVRRVVNGALQILIGVIRLPVGLVRGDHRWLHGAKDVVLGAGMLTGLMGRRYEEYRTVHGS